MNHKEDFVNFRLIKEDKNYIYVKGKSGPAKETRIPKNLTEGLCFLVGVIFGDGHLKIGKKRIVLYLTNGKKLESICNLFEIVFTINQLKIFRRIDKRPGRKEIFYFNLNNSPIYFLFNKIFEIPIGKKSNIIKVPNIIKNANLKMKRSFLLGVLITDGGKRKIGYGLSSASKEFRDDIAELLFERNIKTIKDEWINKTYKKTYYGFYFKKIDIQKMRGCRSGQTGQILDSFYNELEGLA